MYKKTNQFSTASYLAALTDLSIPDMYTKSVSDEPLLLYDSFEENVDNKRILLLNKFIII